jgi:hypothetical protein
VSTADEQAAQENAAQENAAQEKAAQEKAAQEKAAAGLTPEELQRRKDTIKDIGNWKRGLFQIPVRRLTAQDLTEELLLDEIRSGYLKGDPVCTDLLTVEPRRAPGADPAEPKDPLDKIRIIATLIMVIALFAIVAVVVFNPKPPTGIAQLVSLASGLAGIGLGWLFGAASVRGKK